MENSGGCISWWMEEENIEGQISLFDLPEWKKLKIKHRKR